MSKQHKNDLFNKAMRHHDVTIRIDMLKEYCAKYSTDTNALNELGQLYEKHGDTISAIDMYNKLLHVNSSNHAVRSKLAHCYANTQQYHKAAKCYEDLLKKFKHIPEIYTNLAFCQIHLKYIEEAESNCKIALSLKITSDTYHKLADINLYKKDYDTAITFYKKTFELDPTNANMYNIAFPYLAKKEFTIGFKLYEMRLKQHINPLSKLPERVEIPLLNYWNGSDACKNLLIVYEQGIGDNIQWFRFIIELSQKFPEMNITYFCNHIVAHIFNTDGLPNIKIVTEVKNVLLYNYKLYIMSLPYILKITHLSPCKIDYIQRNVEKTKEWGEKLCATFPIKRYTVGFIFNGLLNSLVDKAINLKELLKFVDMNINFVCLTKLDEIRHNPDYEALSSYKNIQFFDLDKKTPFVDTIAIIDNVDLILTVDTFLAHLAGVMNKNTILMLGCYSDWRWFKDDVCMWYDSVELIRNKTFTPLDNIISTVLERLSIRSLCN